MLPQTEYAVMNDVILSTDTGTTQIDHVVVSFYGIFVIETKNYKGWIYGNEDSEQWTQNIFGKKSSFMNPLHQNYAHVKAIKAHLSPYPNLPIISIVAFSANCDLKVKTTSHVVYFHRVCGVIRSYTNKVLNSDNVHAIVKLLQNEKINYATIKKEHAEVINRKKIEIENAFAGGMCPKCAGTLIERNGKYGKFIGCSNYPHCKFTKQG